MTMKATEIKKLPTILTILERIAKWEESLKNDKKWKHLLSDKGVENKFEIRPESKNETYALYPTSSTVNTFFRGQTSYYSSCLPSIYRKVNNQERDQIDIFIDRLRAVEFELLLQKHPFVKYVFNEGLDISGNNMPISLKVDYLALAQHYELKTDLLDFTNDKWVAAFFATCTKVNGKFIPLNCDGYGVIYSYTIFPEPINETLEQNKKFSPVGLQPFPRPGEQKAFALKLNPQEDLNNLSGVQKYFFRHDYQAAEIVYNRMNEGKSLFPDDELVKIANKLKDTYKISKKAFRTAYQRYFIESMNEDNVIKLCTEKGIKFVEYPVVSFSKNIEDKFWKSWYNNGRNEFLSKLVYRPVFS